MHPMAARCSATGANQGLYDGFLAAGLGPAGHAVQLFFPGCVVVAGLYGAMSVGIKILFVQAALAAAAVLLLG